MTQSTSDLGAKDPAPKTRARHPVPANPLAKFVIAGALVATMALPALAESGGYIVFDAASGEIFARHNADQAWYPASITKLMTTYVTFQMIKAGTLSFSSPVVMSAMAASQPPSKMGFPVGTVVTVDNALKMIMVKSANDMAWALGEAVGGSKAAFVSLMNDYARRIGMTETVWDNPNGLPDPNQFTTAHDMGLLARALLREFPDYDFYYRLPGIQLGNRVIRNHNHLMDHYPGADGMKTGYICAAGYNVVASATRNGHRMIAVVLGSHGARPRAELAADLFNHAFEKVGGNSLFSFASQPETLDNYHPGPEANQPVGDIHSEICGGKRSTDSDESIEDTAESAPQASDTRRAVASTTAAPRVARAELLSPHFDIGPPVKVWLGGADSVGTRAAALATPQAVIVTPQPDASPAVAAPPRRAPGAIQPLRQPSPPPQAPAAEAATAPPSQSQPPADTPIVRAFTLFQQQPPVGTPDQPPTTDAATGQTKDPVSPDPAADATAIHVPVPRERPIKSADVTPVKRTVAAAKPHKPAKIEKPKTPPTEN